MNLFQKLKATLRLREAVRKAEEAYSKDGERYYVMPGPARDGSLLVMDRYNFRKLKQKGYISRDVFVRDLEMNSFYFTKYKDGKGSITPEVEAFKRSQYMKWYDNCLKRRKSKKSNEVHSKD